MKLNLVGPGLLSAPSSVRFKKFTTAKWKFKQMIARKIYPKKLNNTSCFLLNLEVEDGNALALFNIGSTLSHAYTFLISFNYRDDDNQQNGFLGRRFQDFLNSFQ